MDETLITRRTSRARWCAWMMLTGLGLRLALALAPGAGAAAVSASAVETATPTALPVVRLEWLAACGQADRLGLYVAGSPACQPAQAVSLTWLQSQAAASSLLAPGEYLGPQSAPDCPVQVFAAGGQSSGAICAGPDGLYRLDAAGLPAGSPSHLWVMGF